jgi:hypothetical protein
MNDTNKPILTSLSFQPSINVSGGAKPITFTVGATDDLSGVDQVQVWFTKPLNIGFTTSSITDNTPVFFVYDFQDSFSDGQSSSINYTITNLNAAGTYTIDHVNVIDKSGNNNAYNTAQLSAVGAQTSFTLQDTSVSIDDVQITEGNGGTKIETFTVTRTGGTAAFDVSFTTSDNTATTADHDYVANTGTLHFGAGVNTQTISVTINGDIKLENSETFFVNLSGATNFAVISDNSALGTIANDEGTRSPHEFNGDGNNDFLWRNDNGSVATWDMNDRSSSGAVVGNASNDWHIAGTGDFNGDGNSDILWRNDNGAVATWDMSDRSSSGAVIANVSND